MVSNFLFNDVISSILMDVLKTISSIPEYVQLVKDLNKKLVAEAKRN